MSAGAPVSRVMSVDVGVHLYPGTSVAVRVYASENRATIRLAGGLGSGMNVTVFAKRPELATLRDALTELLDELDTKRAALAQTVRVDEPAA